MISLIAPRPILFLTGDEDIGSPVSGIQKIEAVVQRVYKLNKADDEFQSIIYPKTGHVYTPDMWDRMTKWMNTQTEMSALDKINSLLVPSHTLYP